MLSSFLTPYQKEPAAGISVGRAASGSQNGNNTSFTITLTGSAPVAGTYLYLMGSTNTGTFTPSAGTGAAWTQIDTGATGSKIFYKKCNGSESNVISVTYFGSAKADSAAGSVIEILSANATNPDAHNASTSTATCPTITSSNVNDIMAIGYANSSAVTPPAGYTLQTSVNGGGSPVCCTGIATKTAAGSGSISPGNWSASVNYAASCLFQP